MIGKPEAAGGVVEPARPDRSGGGTLAPAIVGRGAPLWASFNSDACADGPSCDGSTGPKFAGGGARRPRSEDGP